MHFFSNVLPKWLLNAAIRGCLAALFGATLCGFVHCQPSDVAGGQSRSEKEQLQQKANNTPQLFDTIKGEIERIARAIEAQKDDADAQRKEAREIRDLFAQERMGLWAIVASVIAGAGVLLTGAGLWLIGRTLIYTRKAAEAAVQTVDLSRAMVAEGEKATSAALDAAREAKRQADLYEESFRRLERPYILPGEVDRIRPYARIGQDPLYFILVPVGNYGRTPAIVHYFRVGFGPSTKKIANDFTSPAKSIESNYNFARVIPANTAESEPLQFFLPAAVAIEKQDNKLRVSTRGQNELFLALNTKFEDTLGVIRERRFVWRYDSNRQRFLRYGGEAENYEREVKGDEPS